MLEVIALVSVVTALIGDPVSLGWKRPWPCLVLLRKASWNRYSSGSASGLRWWVRGLQGSVSPSGNGDNNHPGLQNCYEDSRRLMHPVVVLVIGKLSIIIAVTMSLVLCSLQQPFEESSTVLYFADAQVNLPKVIPLEPCRARLWI